MQSWRLSDCAQVPRPPILGSLLSPHGFIKQEGIRDRSPTSGNENEQNTSAVAVRNSTCATRGGETLPPADYHSVAVYFEGCHLGESLLGFKQANKFVDAYLLNNTLCFWRLFVADKEDPLQRFRYRLVLDGN
jgi:hypothetical protein